MHENNILKIQDETIKVVSEIQKLLENSKNLEKEHFQTLDNERKKLENLEFVISIVGTVKAGKSTTINAIVGQEILPNRSAPMTTLPTLVTHKEGQNEPFLTMPKYKVLNNFLKKVREELKNDKKTENATFLKDSHGKEIVKELSKKDLTFIKTSHHPDHVFFASNEAIFLNEGKILEKGVPNEIIREENIEKVYNLKSKIEHLHDRKICIAI